MNLIGYSRVSKENTSGRGVSLDEQALWLTSEAIRRGALLEIVSEGAGVSGKKLSNRPVLIEVLRRLDAGEAHGLVVKKLDRLARSVADFLYILERSRKGKWILIIGDLNIDTSTPMGEAMATISATFAQLERQVISERTKEALAYKKSQGIRIGRRSVLPAKVINEIDLMKASGQSLSSIARDFNLRAVKTAHGGKAWHASTIKAVLERAA